MGRLHVAPRAVLFPLSPIEVLAPVLRGEVVPALARGAFHDDVLALHEPQSYFQIFVTTPAPTVRPPSRIANRNCSSIAIGVISSIVIFVLSTGITISTRAGRSIVTVTSVVTQYTLGRYH